MGFQSIKRASDRQSYEILHKVFTQNDILLLAPGKSLKENKKRIMKYINKYNPIVITLNFCTPDFNSHYAFFSNSKRFHFFKNKLKAEKLITTSNIQDVNSELVFDYCNLVFFHGILYDNCTLMFLKILIELQVKIASIAGFDGFDESLSDQYFNFALNTNATNKKNIEDNKNVKEILKSLSSDIRLNFITPSIFEESFKGN